jgi:hypothetical protein
MDDVFCLNYAGTQEGGERFASTFSRFKVRHHLVIESS